MTSECDLSGLVSFLQVSSVLLPGVSISTVRSRARSLGVLLMRCDERQLQFLKDRGLVHEHTSRAALCNILEAQRLVASFAQLFNPSALVILKTMESETNSEEREKSSCHSVSLY